jgi:hypothetical protein
MSMSTSYRYEVENPSAKTLKKALQRQEQRIRVSWTLLKKEREFKTPKFLNIHVLGLACFKLL